MLIFGINIWTVRCTLGALVRDTARGIRDAVLNLLVRYNYAGVPPLQMNELGGGERAAALEVAVAPCGWIHDAIRGCGNA